MRSLLLLLTAFVCFPQNYALKCYREYIKEGVVQTKIEEADCRPGTQYCEVWFWPQSKERIRKCGEECTASECTDTSIPNGSIMDNHIISATLDGTHCCCKGDYCNGFPLEGLSPAAGPTVFISLAILAAMIAANN